MLGAIERLDLPEHRAVPREQVHLTLHFIGVTEPREVDRTLETVRRAAGGLAEFLLAPERLITLPERPPTRLVAAETDRPPVLLEVQRRLASRLARTPRRHAGDRFRPHLTLCRFRKPAHGCALDEPLEADPFPVRGVALMSSTLTPDGARHRELAACPFAASS